MAQATHPGNEAEELYELENGHLLPSDEVRKHAKAVENDAVDEEGQSVSESIGAAEKAGGLKGQKDRWDDGRTFTKPADDSDSGGSASNKKSKGKFGFITKKRTILGGGLTGSIILIALFLGSILQGPFEFIHMAQLLQRFHFAPLQDQSDDRLLKEIRDIRYIKGGRIENTRLGYFSNKYAKRMDANLAKSGIESRYTDLFGFKEGFVVDPEKLSGSKLQDLQGKTPAELKAYFETNFKGVVVDTTTEPGKLFIDSVRTDPIGNAKLNRFILQSAGYSKKSSVIGARVMGKRDAVSWNPIKNIDKKIFKSIEERRKEYNKRRVAEIDRGSVPEISGKANPKDTQPATADSANNAAAQTDEIGAHSRTTAARVAAGDAEAVPALESELNEKLGQPRSGKVTTALSAAAVAGVLCTARGIAQDSSDIKQAEVVLPLMRMGMEAITVGNQIMAGINVDSEQLGFLEKQLSSVEGSWTSARSIQAELGQSQIGKAADATLSTISIGTPFDFLTQGTWGSVLAGVCSRVGTGIQIAISFLGGPASAVVGLVVGQVIGGPIISAMAHWFSGQAVDVLNVAGPDYGNYINYGTKLAANGQAISSGGRILTTPEADQLRGTENAKAAADFQSQSTAYKLFNLYDVNSSASQLVDKLDPDPMRNLSKMGDGLLNLPKLLSSPFKFFSKLGPAAQAAPGPYDYGFPTLGFSEAEMQAGAYNHPYTSANEVLTNVLPVHPEYVQRVKSCFGITMDPTSYDITSFGNNGDEPKYSDIEKSNCTDPAQGWVGVRFYIFDSLNMISAACYEGDDEACQIVSFGAGTAGAAAIDNTAPNNKGSYLGISQVFQAATLRRLGVTP